MWGLFFKVTRCTICVQSGEGARSPTVFAAIISYIMNILDVFGIELLDTSVRIYELCAIYFLTFVLHGFTFKLNIAAKYQLIIPQQVYQVNKQSKVKCNVCRIFEVFRHIS